METGMTDRDPRWPLWATALLLIAASALLWTAIVFTLFLIFGQVQP
jgi:hypothetical protein